jgi:hypothetical protein
MRFHAAARVFHDKRLTVLILVLWSATLLIVFFSLGVLESHFFRFGPSDNLHFMTVPIDTWSEWSMLSAYCCVDTLIHSFGHDSMTPWLTTTIADPKVTELPYSKRTCLVLIELYHAYLHLSYMFKFFLSFTQFDFVLITTLSDMAMKVYSCGAYMEDKTPAATNAAALASSASADSECLLIKDSSSSRSDGPVPCDPQIEHPI